MSTALAKTLHVAASQSHTPRDAPVLEGYGCCGERLVGTAGPLHTASVVGAIADVAAGLRLTTQSASACRLVREAHECAQTAGVARAGCGRPKLL